MERMGRERERETDTQIEECPERYHDATAAYITEREGRGWGRYAGERVCGIERVGAS